MRPLSALALFVYLATTSSASSPATSWSAVHDEARQAFKRNDFRTAIDLFRQAAQLARTSVQRGVSANDLGVTWHELGREPEARLQLETALHIWRSLTGRAREVAVTSHALATICRNTGDYTAAEQVLRDALTTLPP